MKISNIIIAALILICAIGTVAAVEESDIKLPDNFKELGNFSYADASQNLQIDVFNGSDELIDDAFDDDADVKYNVTLDENNTYNFTDGVNDEKGFVELIEINGEKLIVSAWVEPNADDTLMQTLKENLNEFNKANNVEPINVTALDKTDDKNDD